jgi:hypothetical protein
MSQLVIEGSLAIDSCSDATFKARHNSSHRGSLWTGGLQQREQRGLPHEARVRERQELEAERGSDRGTPLMGDPFTGPLLPFRDPFRSDPFKTPLILCQTRTRAEETVDGMVWGEVG